MRLALLLLAAFLPLAASAQIRTSDAPRTASLGAARDYIADVG